MQQPAVAQRRAIGVRLEHQAQFRRKDDAGHGLFTNLCRHTATPERQAMGEVDGAVDRVDHPAHVRGGEGGVRCLLAQDGVVRAGGTDRGEGDILCLTVELVLDVVA